MKKVVTIGIILILVTLLVTSVVPQEYIKPDSKWEIEIFIDGKGGQDSLIIGGVDNAKEGYDIYDITKVLPDFDKTENVPPTVIEIMSPCDVISDMEEYYQIIVYFDKPMKQVIPNIVFSSNSIICIYGSWIDGGTIWFQEFRLKNIDNQINSVTVTISGVSDVFGNIMKSYTSKPLFDIVPPVKTSYVFSKTSTGIYLEYDSRDSNSKTDVFQIEHIWLSDDEELDTITLSWNVDKSLFKLLIINVNGERIDMLNTYSVEIEIKSGLLYGFTIESVMI